MPKSTFRLPRAPVVLLALALAGCLRDADPVTGIPRGAADGLYPQLVVSGTRSARTEIRLSLLRKPAGVRLGSYQGELRFDAGALTYEAAEFPAGVEGVAHLVAPGRVRFVGTALDGVGEAPLLTLRLRRTAPLSAASLGAVFEDVSDAEFNDLTPSLHPGPPLTTLR